MCAVFSSHECSVRVCLVDGMSLILFTPLRLRQARCDFVVWQRKVDAMAPMIQVSSLCKNYQVPVKEPGLVNTIKHFFARKYRNVEAVKSLSFEIEEGEFVGFLGPNGAGKTTTLKMLTGLIHPSSGSVQIAGFTPFDRKTPFLKSISLVMGQKQQLLWDLPALDSLRINAAVYDIERNEAQRRISELAEMLSLDEELKKPVRKLSLGERMKCELLAALLHNPQILFLDEPTLGLDINAQAAVRAFLKAYNETHKATILLTSHYMADITELCQRVLVIHEGVLRHNGELSELAEKFAPYRELSVQFSEAVSEADLKPYGEIQKHVENSCVLLVPQTSLTETTARLLQSFTVTDLSISEPPFEKIIGRMFQGQSADEAMAGEALKIAESNAAKSAGEAESESTENASEGAE